MKSNDYSDSAARLRHHLLVTANIVLAVIAHNATAAQVEFTINGTPRAVTQIVTAYIADRDHSCATPPERSKTQKTIRQALDALGYFSATSKVRSVDPAHCTIDITLAQRPNIIGWDLQFSQDPSTSQPLREAMALVPAIDTPFDPQAYESLRKSLQTTLADAGYLDTKFEQASVDVDLAANTANVQWRIDPGQRYRIDPLIIEPSVLNESLILHLLEINAGDYFNRHGIVAATEHLINSDYFSSASVTPLLEDRRDARIPVNVSTTPARKWSYLVGPGFATDTGPRFRAEANARYLNPRGHRAGFTSMFSPVAGNIKSNYRWPYHNPNHDWYTLEGITSYENTDTAKSRTTALGIRRTTRLTKKWAHTQYLDYSEERFDVSTQEGKAQLLTVGSNLTFTSTIDQRRPRTGRSISLDIRAASSVLLSDNDIVQLRVAAKQIIPFVGNSRLLLRAEAGVSWQDSFTEMPASMRFFAGGDKSVRGFSLDSIGTEDDTGNVIGGDRLLTGSIEWDVGIRRNWSVALFADAGSAFINSPQFSHGIGAGLRWYSPLGPIRLDLAHPLDNSSQLIRLHLSLGPDI